MPGDAGTVLLAPTATKLPVDAAGRVVVCGSHGGAYAGYLLASAGVRAFALNDAGVGLQAAGIGALALADELGLAAVTVAHDSARIGDAADMLARGRLSHVNVTARAAGCRPGQACAEAAGCLAAAPLPSARPAPCAEARHLLGVNRAGLRLVAVDSISLVVAEDAGQVVVSGSHGGLVSGQPGLAIRVQAALALFNDAGVGIDAAGISRLPVLDAMGVPAATVAAHSARIGDARSTLADGVISHANALATALGVRPGLTARDACERAPGGV